MSGGHDKNTTYIIYKYNIGVSFEDICGNIYILDTNFQNYTYTNSEKLLVPTFSNYNPSSPTTTSPYNDMVEVVLGDNIEAGICNFSFCKSLESVTINYRNDRISIGAFGFCQSLTLVTIPNTIRSIEEGAFYACNKLTNFNFDSITYIGFASFQECGAFTTLTFNNSSYFFVSQSFDNCRYLTNISFTNDKCSGVIQPNAFVSTGLTSVTLPPNMIWTANTGNGIGGSFPSDCTVTEGQSGSGVVGEFLLSLSGMEEDGLSITGTASTTATATGNDVDTALDALLDCAHKFLKKHVKKWATQNSGGAGANLYTFEFTIG